MFVSWEAAQLCVDNVKCVNKLCLVWGSLRRWWRSKWLLNVSMSSADFKWSFSQKSSFSTRRKTHFAIKKSELEFVSRKNKLSVTAQSHNLEKHKKMRPTYLLHTDAETANKALAHQGHSKQKKKGEIKSSNISLSSVRCDAIRRAAPSGKLTSADFTRQSLLWFWPWLFNVTSNTQRAVCPPKDFDSVYFFCSLLSDVGKLHISALRRDCIERLLINCSKHFFRCHCTQSRVLFHISCNEPCIEHLH